MVRAETARNDGIEAVAILTPNRLHTPIATAFLKAGRQPDPAVLYPTIDDGVKGVAFIDTAVRSSAQGGASVRPSTV